MIPKPILKKRSFSQEWMILVSFRSPSIPFYCSLVHAHERQTWTSVEHERVNLILKAWVYIHPGSVSSCVVFAVHKLRWHVTRKLISRCKVTELWWFWGVRRGRSDIPIIELRKIRVRVKLLDNSRLFSNQEKKQICDYNWMNEQSHVGWIISGSKSTALVCTCFWFSLQLPLVSAHPRMIISLNRANSFSAFSLILLFDTIVFCHGCTTLHAFNCPFNKKKIELLWSN